LCGRDQVPGAVEGAHQWQELASRVSEAGNRSRRFVCLSMALGEGGAAGAQRDDGVASRPGEAYPPRHFVPGARCNGDAVRRMADHLVRRGDAWQLKIMTKCQLHEVVAVMVG